MSDIKQFTFNLLIEEQDGAYVAYCLEAGLVATSDDMTDLPHKMIKMLSRQINFALKNNNPGDIFHPAPPDVWQRFLAAKAQVEGTQRRIQVEHTNGVMLNQNAYATNPC